MSEATTTQPQQEDALQSAPALNYELEPWPLMFWRNLIDLLLCREPPPVETTAEPVPIPEEKWIATGLGPRHYLESYGYHIALVVVIYVVCTSSWFNRPVRLESPFANTEVEHYALSEYLPPINTGPRGETKPRKGQPKLAKQEILSVPPNPDNNHQTIVTPPNIKLKRDISLPNMVAWTNIPGQPIAASQRQISQLKLPQFTPQVVEPTADVSKLKSQGKMAALEQPTGVEAKADVAQLKPDVAAAKLPVEPQRAGGVGDAAAANGAGKNVPAQPSLQGLQSSKGQGQIIALSLNPSDVRGPVEIPAGNRSGEFHASPGGKADAPGTPNVTGTSGGTGGGAGGGKGNGSGNGGTGTAPPGISVGAAPPGAPVAATAGMPGGKMPSDVQKEENKRLIAAAMRPNIPSVSRPPVAPPPPEVSDVETDSIERKVFGTKKYYSLILNMPNLTSASGSWVVRFAELQESDNKVPIAAPVAMSKFDPAYPADALRDNAEGIVKLYAIIHTDGTVSGIKLLNGVDPRLDEAAERALSRWVFRPGTKNGDPIDLEAVVLIPFKKYHVR